MKLDSSIDHSQAAMFDNSTYKLRKSKNGTGKQHCECFYNRSESLLLLLLKVIYHLFKLN